MSEYFSNFPRILYDIEGNNSTSPEYTVAVNVMIRQKFRDAIKEEISMYYPYIIPDEMSRPDILAFNIYGDVKYTWTIFMVNNMLDPFWSWPMDEKNFAMYLTNKYGSVDKSKIALHHYEQIIRTRTEATGVSEAILEKKIEVDVTTYNSLAAADRNIVYNQVDKIYNTLSNIFEISKKDQFSYMEKVVKVKKNYQRKLQAITHLDGSARVQTVDKKDNKDLYDILKEFENFLKNVPKQSLNRLIVKNHPTMKNSTNHLDIQTNLDKIILQYEDRFSKEKLSKNISVFIGPTTGAIVALEKELKVFHICFNSILESYSEKLWPMLTVKQLSANMFEYNLKKRGEYLKKNLIAGFQLTCLGDRGNFTYKTSKFR